MASNNQQFTPHPQSRPIATIETYGRRKYDAVIIQAGRVVERTEFPTRREAEQFVRLLQRAGECRYMPPASGGSGGSEQLPPACRTCGEPTWSAACPECAAPAPPAAATTAPTANGA